MAFRLKQTNNNGGPLNTAFVLLGNSQTFAVGDVVKSYTNGVADNGAAALPILGIIQSIVGANGQPVVQGDPTAGSTNTSDVSSVTTGAANTTYYAYVNTSKSDIYSAEVNGTIGTTVNSDKRGAQIDVDSANTDYGRVLETTATRTVGTPANFYSHGTDPEDSTRLLVSIALSELDSVYE